MKKFYPHNKPYPPTPPREKIRNAKTLTKETVYNYSSFPIEMIPQGTTEIYLEVSDYDDYNQIEVSFISSVIIDNPNYDKQYAAYEKNLEKHKTELKEWKAQKKIYDAEQEAQAKEHRLKQYEQLKKEFE